MSGHGLTLLNVQDLFAVGLGFDIAGGALVARGLLTDTADMATAATFAGWGAQSTVSAVGDRVDASFGLGFLGLGFGLQVIGYLCEESGVQPPATGSWSQAGTFALLTAIAVVLALLVHRYLAPSRKRRMALEVTLLDGHGLPESPASGRKLMDLGVELGDDAHDGETFGQYAKRVWSIDDVSDPDRVPDETTGRPRRQAGRRRPR